MKLSYVDEMPCLEHDELIYLTEDQYKKLSKMNAERAKAFLIREVKKGLTEKEKIILNRWLNDSLIDWYLRVDNY